MDETCKHRKEYSTTTTTSGVFARFSMTGRFSFVAPVGNKLNRSIFILGARQCAFDGKKEEFCSLWPYRLGKRPKSILETKPISKRR